jgi:hypothetical protein
VGPFCGEIRRSFKEKRKSRSLQSHTELGPRHKEKAMGGYTPYNHAPQPNIKYRGVLNNSLRTLQESKNVLYLQTTLVFLVKF